MEVNCGRRESSTVATQSLMLMNSDFVLKCAQAFADRIVREVDDQGQGAGVDERLLDLDGLPVTSPIATQLVHGWQLAYGRTPSQEELQLSAAFFREQLDLLETQEHEAPARQALANYCHVLLSSNEFLYIE